MLEFMDAACIRLVREVGGADITDAGIARLVRSLTIAAAVYCTIMKPDSVPSSLPIRNAGRPSLVAGSTSLLRRRSEIDASRDRGLDVAHRQRQRHAVEVAGRHHLLLEIGRAHV